MMHSPYAQVIELEDRVETLKSAIQGAIEAGLVSITSQKDGETAKFDAQARAADIMREALHNAG